MNKKTCMRFYIAAFCLCLRLAQWLCHRLNSNIVCSAGTNEPQLRVCWSSSFFWTVSTRLLRQWNPDTPPPSTNQLLHRRGVEGGDMKYSSTPTWGESEVWRLILDLLKKQSWRNVLALFFVNVSFFLLHLSLPRFFVPFIFIYLFCFEPLKEWDRQQTQNEIRAASSPTDCENELWFLVKPRRRQGCTSIRTNTVYKMFKCWTLPAGAAGKRSATFQSKNQTWNVASATKTRHIFKYYLNYSHLQ